MIEILIPIIMILLFLGFQLEINPGYMISIIGFLVITNTLISLLDIKQKYIPMAFENNETISCYGIDNNVSKDNGWIFKNGNFINSKDGIKIETSFCFLSDDSKYIDKMSLNNILTDKVWEND